MGTWSSHSGLRSKILSKNYLRCQKPSIWLPTNLGFEINVIPVQILVNLPIFLLCTKLYRKVLVVFISNVRFGLVDKALGSCVRGPGFKPGLFSPWAFAPLFLLEGPKNFIGKMAIFSDSGNRRSGSQRILVRTGPFYMKALKNWPGQARPFYVVTYVVANSWTKCRFSALESVALVAFHCSCHLITALDFS